MSRLSLWMVTLVTVSCTGAPAPQRAADAASAVHVTQRPPSDKDIIDAVIASGSIALDVSPTCQNVGTEPSDKTIGRYLAGFLAELSAPDKKNWIETERVDGTSERSEPVWICRLTLRHEDGDDRWGWGVQFQVRQSDGLVLADSFTCTGAG